MKFSLYISIPYCEKIYKELEYIGKISSLKVRVKCDCNPDYFIHHKESTFFCGVCESMRTPLSVLNHVHFENINLK